MSLSSCWIRTCLLYATNGFNVIGVAPGLRRASTPRTQMPQSRDQGGRSSLRRQWESMSDLSQGPGWWIASDGNWYPPDSETVHDFNNGEGCVSAHRHPRGGGWIADSATVDPTAYVGPNAAVFGNASVLDTAWIDGTAWVLDDAVVAMRARVTGDAEVSGRAVVTDDAQVSESAWIGDDARVQGHGVASGKVKVLGESVVDGSTQILGSAVLGVDDALTPRLPPLGLSQPKPIFKGKRKSRGMGWWQGADRRWYPPEAISGVQEPAESASESNWRRGWGLPVVILIVLVVAIGVMVVVASRTSRNGSSGGSPSGTQTTTVTLSVSGTGNAGSVTIIEPGGVTQHTNATLPFSTSVPLASGSYGITAQDRSGDTSATISCAVDATGFQPIQNSSTGAFAIVNCSAKLP
jgi:hypothetical protein